MRPTLPAWRRTEIRARATSAAGHPAALVPGHLALELLAAYEGELAYRGALDEGRSPTEGRDPEGWILTYSGVRFWPLDPRAEEVRIEDVAHGLSNLCRFAGHVQQFYCPTPEQRILTADLRWVPAGDLKVGDELLGFDEEPHEPGGAGTRRRRYRHSRVLTAMPVRREVIRLELDDGTTLRASAEHPWLIRSKQAGNQRWVRAGDIATAIEDDRPRYMNRFLKPWSYIDTRDAGWLAGMYDGEGSISIHDRNGTQLGVAQKVGDVLTAIEMAHRRLGFDALTYAQNGDVSKGVMNIQLRGGWREIARLLGSVRPMRLLSKFLASVRDGNFAKQMDGDRTPIRIVRAYREGEEWVAGLETSTRTYICEGFGAHNSVAQHSVLVSHACHPDDALWGLLHDATEAYLVDMPKPVKRAPELAGYRAAERRLELVIAEAFGRPPAMPASVHVADARLLATEKRDLRTHRDGIPGAKPLPSRIDPWGPELARDAFLRRFEELTGRRR